MGTILKGAISLAVAAIGTLEIATGIIKVSGALFAGPPEYGGRVYHILVPLTVIGSLVLSPLLFALCYRLLSRKARPASPTDGAQP